MSIFGGRNNQPSGSAKVPPELKPYYDAQKIRHDRYRFISATIVVIVVVVLGLFFGVWFHGSNNNQNHSKSASSQSVGSSKGSPKNQISVNQNNSSTISPAPITSSPSTTQSTPTPSSAVMPNTGPGNSLFLIVGSSIVLGAVFYQVLQIRNTRKT